VPDSAGKLLCFVPFFVSLPLIPFANFSSVIGFGQPVRDDGNEIGLRVTSTGFALVLVVMRAVA
jgi:hypothetical protein